MRQFIKLLYCKEYLAANYTPMRSNLSHFWFNDVLFNNH